MRRTLLLAALAPLVAPAAALPAQDPNPQRVLLVLADAQPDAARSEAFTAFLQKRFATARVVAAADLDAATLAETDVVLLDWSQQDGVMRWMNQKDQAPTSPLGERAAWRTPTVLLGSAGLSVASSWDVRGGSG